MKHTLLITTALFITSLMLFVGCGSSEKEPVDETILINKEGVMYLPDSDTPYTGEVFTNYDTGEKEYQGTYENGLLVSYSYLHKDGRVKDPVNGETLIDRSGLLYEVNGQKPYTGDVFELYDDGGRKHSGSLKGGKKDKLWTEWSDNGKKQRELTYKDGILDGKSTDWYENGQKRLTIYYSMGVVSYYLNKAYESSLISFDPVFVLCDRSSLELIPETWLFSTEFWQQVTNNLFSAAAKAIIIDGSLQNVSEWYESIPNDRSGKLIYLTTQEPTKSSYIMDLSLSPYNSFPGFQFHLFLESFSLFQIVDVADVDLRDFDADIDWMDMFIDSTHWAYYMPGMGGLDSSPFKDKIVIIMYQP